MRIISIGLLLSTLAADSANAQPVGACETPVAERTGPLGCYLLASHAVGQLPARDMFWHRYTYSTLADANAAHTPNSTVVQSHGQNWLFAIAEREWRPASGVRRAVVGPLPHSTDVA